MASLLTRPGLVAALSRCAALPGRERIFLLQDTSVDGSVAHLLAHHLPAGSTALVGLCSADTPHPDPALAHTPGASSSEPDVLVFWGVDALDEGQARALMDRVLAHLSQPFPIPVLLIAFEDPAQAIMAHVPKAHIGVFDIAPTPVLFRAERAGIYKGQITAVFPTLPGTNNPATFTVYAHIGQHGTGTRGWYADTRPATPEEYAPLLAELERAGYLPDVRARWTPAFDTARAHALRAFDTVGAPMAA